MRHRRQLLEKNLLYVFSIDGNLEYGREDVGLVPGGLRINVNSIPQGSRAYNVAGESRVAGERTVSGTIAWGSDWVLAGQDDVERLSIKVVIRTDDGACIEAAYRGVLASRPRGFRQIVSENPRVGSERHPIEGTFYVAPRCRSGDPRYQWLNERQFLAFGRVTFIESVARQATLDFWMMD